MKRRWQILIVVGLLVAVLDQWSKFLAVKHLTPGIAIAHTGVEHVAPSELQRSLTETTLGTQLGYFYGDIKGPCRVSRQLCPTVSVVDGFWNWRYVENPGAAWGLLAGANENLRVPFFLLVSLVAIGFIITFFRKLEDHQYLLVISLSLVFGGAIGNLIDRLHLSYVIDFIDWYIGTAHWPTFNVADAAITSGVALLMLEWAFDAKNKKAPAKAPVKA